MAGRTSGLCSVEIKTAASAMEQPRGRPGAGTEAGGVRWGLSQAAEQRIEDRIRLLLRCSRRPSALTQEAQGSNSVSRLVEGSEPWDTDSNRKGYAPRREASGLGWDILQKCVAQLPVPSRAHDLSSCPVLPLWSRLAKQYSQGCTGG